MNLHIIFLTLHHIDEILGEVEMKRIALINDLSGLGKCSLTAAIPVISVMGMQACPLPTAILSAQTGFDNYYCDDFTNRMDCFTKHWKEMGERFDGIASGYLASPMQIEKVLQFLEAFKEENTIYLADPILGDDGEVYKVYSEDLLNGMKRLTLQADIITPNLTELCLLVGTDYEKVIAYKKDVDYLQRIEDLCGKLLSKAQTSQTIIVTGIVRKKNEKEFVGNLAVSKEGSCYVETTYTGKSFSGTGDLFSSVVCGSFVKGLSVKEGMEKATGFLQQAIEEATASGVDSPHGVYFEKYLSYLL